MRYALTLTSTDATEIRDGLDGWRWRALVRDLDEWLRSQVKYAELPEAEAKAAAAIRAQIHLLLEEEGLALED